MQEVIKNMGNTSYAFAKRFANFQNIIIENCASWGIKYGILSKLILLRHSLEPFHRFWNKLFDSRKFSEYAADNNHYALITSVYEVIARHEERTIGGQARYPPTRSLFKSLKEHFHGNLENVQNINDYDSQPSCFLHKLRLVWK